MLWHLLTDKLISLTVAKWNIQTHFLKVYMDHMSWNICVLEYSMSSRCTNMISKSLQYITGWQQMSKDSGQVGSNYSTLTNVWSFSDID